VVDECQLKGWRKMGVLRLLHKKRENAKRPREFIQRKKRRDSFIPDGKAVTHEGNKREENGVTSRDLLLRGRAGRVVKNGKINLRLEPEGDLDDVRTVGGKRSRNGRSGLDQR